MAENASKQLLGDIKSFLSTGAFSDLVITCSNDTYNVHKVIVCTRSEFFAKAVKFDVGKEAAEGKIDLPEDDPAMIRLLIQYLYEAEYEPCLPSEAPRVATTNAHTTQTQPHTCTPSASGFGIVPCSNRAVCSHHTCGHNCRNNCVNFKCAQCLPPPELSGTADQLITHAKMYEIGDKYNVSGLKELSLHKFQRACGKYWNYPEFAEAANHAFSTTPDDDKGLRDIVCTTISEHMVLMKEPEVEALLTEFNGLAFGLLKKKAAQHNWLL